MNRLIDIAMERWNQIKKGTYRYSDDDAFVIVKGGSGRLLQPDTSIHHSTLKPQKLIRNDGTIASQIVESVRRPDLRMKDDDRSFSRGTRFLTLWSFLSANATRGTDSMDGLDWCSSNNATPCALQVISSPLLITSMGAHHFVRDNEIHYEIAKSKDKDLVYIEGAQHGMTPCVPCETTPGQYSNTVKNLFDYVKGWVNARY